MIPLRSSRTLCSSCIFRYLRSSAPRTYATSSDNPTPLTEPAKQTPKSYVSPRKANTAQNTNIRAYKPITPSIRHLRRPINDHLWKGKPYRPLTFPKKGQGRGGRNNTGRITVRHRGGGHKRRIRTVDFMRLEPGKQLVERIEHDPNRSAHIALLTHKDSGSKTYIIAADGMRAGDEVESFRGGLPKELLHNMGGSVDPGLLAAKTAVRGNCLPICMVPVGTQVYSVGSAAERGAVFCRSAGTYAIVISKIETKRKCKDVIVRLQSGETRRVDPEACATIGVASNPHFQYRQLGKAGRSRWLGIRPTVRGVAMNAVDHPHGGGRGKTKGNKIPVSPWGTPAKSGYKTRKKSNKNTWLVADRPRNQGKRRNKTG